MKNSILTTILLFIGSWVIAQSMQPLNVSITNDLVNSNEYIETKSVTCGSDTVRYPLAKASGLTALSINNSTSAKGVSQYYNAPQAITISGLEFYAYKIDLTGGASLDVTASVYLAGADSMPTGSPLATTTVPVDTTFLNGTLSDLHKTASFTPFTVAAPYVVVLENNSAYGVGMIFNDYNTADGAQEWLCSVDLFGTWTRSYNVNVGGSIFDADLLCHPVASYVLGASYIPTNECLTSGQTAVFINSSSPILWDRMYNQAAYLNLPETSFSWQYGDGSPLVNVVDGLHTYSGSPNVEYLVTLTDSLFGWTSTCVHDTIGIVGDSISVDFSNIQNGAVVDFTQLSYATSGISSYFWDFGDGNTSMQANPSYTYGADGTYTVCLTVVSNCGWADSVCHIYNVTTCLAPVADFSVTNNEPSFVFTNTSSTTGSTSYSWTMGDGSTYSTMDASHTYVTNGTYTVTLIVTDSCGVDSISQTITVSNVGIGDLNSIGLKFYPNPADYQFLVQADLAIDHVRLTTLAGQEVWSNTVNNKTVVIKTDKLADGQYLLSVESEDGSTERCVILVKH